jgi:hypothetical protein
MPAEQFPCVRSLTYSIHSRAGYEYDDQCELDGVIAGFSYRLRHRAAQFLPTQHFATEGEARAGLEPFLRTWEVGAALNYGRGVIEFVFTRCDIQKEAPRPDLLELRGAVLTFSGSVPTVTMTFTASHPSPPEAFATNEFVSTLADLYLIARDYPRVLQYIAHSVMTCVEGHFDGFGNAARVLGIEPGIFSEIDRLSHTPGPIRDLVREWLMTLLREIALRAGASATGAPVGGIEVTLASYPVPEN